MNNSSRLEAGSILLILGLASAPLAQGGELALKIGSHAIHAEIADTPPAREHGLMQRKTLCGDCGMLFVFPAAARQAFWMKNTPLPLAIAFIGSDGRIINIEEMQPYSLDIHYSQADAQYALEMNRRWFAAHGINPGDKMISLRQDGARVDSVSIQPLPQAQK